MDPVFTMTRLLLRLLLAPVTIAAIGAVICVPLLLAISHTARQLWLGHNLREPMDIVDGMGVILIGWGVALEEREALREIFKLTATEEEGWQAAIDHICHASGIGVLVFGLFSEMCVEMVRLPNHIINTEGIDDVVLWGSLFFLGLSVLVLLQHIAALIRKLFQDRRVLGQ